MEYAIKRNGIYESIPFNSTAIQTQGKGVITLQAKIDNNEFVNYQSIPKSNTVTKLDIPNTVDCRLISKSPFNYTIPGVYPKYSDKQKVEDFLYEIQYGNIDYNYAKQYFIDTQLGGCSAIRNGNWFGRNFDWLYNNDIQFVVHTPTSLNRFGVLGVSGIIPGITKDTVDQDNIIIDGIDMFKLLPFYLLDGINEKGLFCTHNVVPLDNEENPTIEIQAQKEEKERICVPMLVRYILDNFSLAEQAIEYIKNYVTIYFSNTMISDWKYQSHFLIGDANSTYIIEFINNEMLVYKQNYITNFSITDVQFNSNNHIQYPPTQYGMNKYGSGLERWDIIANTYQNTNSLNGMRQCLDLIKFSNCYESSTFWFSEAVKREEDDHSTIITVDSIPENCKNAKRAMMSAYHNKNRDNPRIWITCHSSVYDINGRKLYLKNQENELEYIFDL